MNTSLKKLFDWLPELRGLLLSKSEDDFDLVFEQHMEQCVQRMEAEAHHLSKDSEEKLSAFLGAALSLPGLSVTREGYSNGRVDLTVRREGLDGGVRLAEAKIYSGPTCIAESRDGAAARECSRIQVDLQRSSSVLVQLQGQG